VFHKGCARPISSFRVAANHGRQQFSADQSARFRIVRPNHALIISAAGENLVCFFGSSTRPFAPAIFSRDGQDGSDGRDGRNGSDVRSLSNFVGSCQGRGSYHSGGWSYVLDGWRRGRLAQCGF
jgi:hypothetical protein